MIRYILCVLGFITFVSCGRVNVANFEITNNSNYQIDSLQINTIGYTIDSEYITLKPGEKDIYQLNMSDVPNIDGSYYILFIKNGAVRDSFPFGYFTNGYPVEKLTEINIMNDTILVQSMFGAY